MRNPLDIEQTEFPWTRAWVGWALLSGLSAAVIGALPLLGYTMPANIWWWWLGGVALIGGPLELVALFRKAQGDTLSEQVWSITGGLQSFVVFFCLWGAWVFLTLSLWPSAPVMFLLWAAWHFYFDSPERRSTR